MVKVFTAFQWIKQLHVVNIPKEPLKLCSACQGTFLVAIKKGFILFLKVPSSEVGVNDIKPDDSGTVLNQIEDVEVKAFKTVDSSVFAIKYLKATDSVVTLENDSDTSSIRVVRIYPSWRKESKEFTLSSFLSDQERGKQKIGILASKSVTLPLPEEANVLATCPVSGWLAVASSTRVSLWSMEPKPHHVLDVFQPNVSSLSIHGCYLAYTTSNEAFAIQINLSHPKPSSNFIKDYVPNPTDFSCEKSVTESLASPSIILPAVVSPLLPQGSLGKSARCPRRRKLKFEKDSTMKKHFIEKESMSVIDAYSSKEGSSQIPLFDNAEETSQNVTTTKCVFGSKGELLGVPPMMKLDVPSIPTRNSGSIKSIEKPVLGPIENVFVIETNKDENYKLISSSLLIYHTLDKAKSFHSLMWLPEYNDISDYPKIQDVQGYQRTIERKLMGMRLFFSTKVSGYLYSLFTPGNASKQKANIMETDKRLSPSMIATYSYPHASSSFTVVCSSSLLFVIADDGLAIAALRTSVASNLPLPSPMWIGSKSFSGLKEMLVVDENYLVLLSKTTEEELQSKLRSQLGSIPPRDRILLNATSVSRRSFQQSDSLSDSESISVGWKIELLQLCSPQHLQNQISDEAQKYQNSNSSVYYHLIVEAHYIALTCFSYIHATPATNLFSNLTHIPTPNLKRILRVSYSHLSDLFLTLPNFDLAVHCLARSSRTVSDVMNILLLEPGATPSILKYLDVVLFDPKGKYLVNCDDVLSDTILTYYARHAPASLARVILLSHLSHCPYSRYIATQLLLRVKSELHEPSSLPPPITSTSKSQLSEITDETEVYLALASLYLALSQETTPASDAKKIKSHIGQSANLDSTSAYACAVENLLHIPAPALINMCSMRKDLILEHNTLKATSFAKLLRDVCPWILLEVLVRWDKEIDFSKVVEILYLHLDEGDKSFRWRHESLLNRFLLLSYCDYFFAREEVDIYDRSKDIRKMEKEKVGNNNDKEDIETKYSVHHIPSVVTFAKLLIGIISLPHELLEYFWEFLHSDTRRRLKDNEEKSEGFFEFAWKEFHLRSHKYEPSYLSVLSRLHMDWETQRMKNKIFHMGNKEKEPLNDQFAVGSYAYNNVTSVFTPRSDAGLHNTPTIASKKCVLYYCHKFLLFLSSRVNNYICRTICTTTPSSIDNVEGEREAFHEIFSLAEKYLPMLLPLKQVQVLLPILKIPLLKSEDWLGKKPMIPNKTSVISDGSILSDVQHREFHEAVIKTSTDLLLNSGEVNLLQEYASESCGSIEEWKYVLSSLISKLDERNILVDAVVVTEESVKSREILKTYSTLMERLATHYRVPSLLKLIPDNGNTLYHIPFIEKCIRYERGSLMKVIL